MIYPYVIGCMAAPRGHICVLILEPVKVTFFGKRVFADVIKDLEMRSPWIIKWALNPRTRGKEKAM